jgi:hypothetical protein
LINKRKAAEKKAKMKDGRLLRVKYLTPP